MEAKSKKPLRKKREPRRRKSSGEIIRFVEFDRVRELKVPRTHITPKPMVVDPRKFDQIQEKAQITTFQDKMRKLEEARVAREKEAREIEALSRKAQHELELQFQEFENVTAEEKEEREKANYLLKRSEQLRLEQEDEIKKCNALILATKCNAVRDAQVAEKRLLKKEMDEYELKMDDIMEKERLRGIEADERKKERELEKKHEFIANMMQQIQENQIALDREAEILEQEMIANKQLTKKIKAEEEEERKRQREMQKKIREEMTQLNNQLKQFAQVRKEQNRLADLKIQEFMRQKAEREAKREEELKRMRLLREKELVKMRAEQQRAGDVQARKDAILALRIQDEVEREWRKREKAAVLKEKAELEQLQKARAVQILDKRKNQAMEIMKQNEEVQKMLRVCQEEQEKQKLTQLQKKLVVQEYRETLLQQINERIEEKKKERQRIIEMGEAWKAEREQQDRTLKEIMMKKIDAVKSHDVPEAYIREIERQLNLSRSH